MPKVNGPLIREMRQDRQLTGRALARQCRITSQSLSRIETGHAQPSIEVCYRLAAALGRQPAQIAPGLPDPAEARTIRARRQARGLKLSEMADAIGYSPTHLSNVEKGTFRGGAALLAAIAGILGCDPADLGADDDDEPEAAAA